MSQSASWVTQDATTTATRQGARSVNVPLLCLNTQRTDAAVTVWLQDAAHLPVYWARPSSLTLTLTLTPAVRGTLRLWQQACGLLVGGLPGAPSSWGSPPASRFLPPPLLTRPLFGLPTPLAWDHCVHTCCFRATRRRCLHTCCLRATSRRCLRARLRGKRLRASLGARQGRIRLRAAFEPPLAALLRF